jgi:hypothetical protein
MGVLAVVGGRKFNNYELLRSELDKFVITKIVSGGAKGADELAYRYSVEKGIVFNCFPPSRSDKLQYGYARACKRRNLRIVEACDRLIAFPDHNSKGTYHSISLAKGMEKPVRIIKPQEVEDGV